MSEQELTGRDHLDLLFEFHLDLQILFKPFQRDHIHVILFDHNLVYNVEVAAHLVKSDKSHWLGHLVLNHRI